MVARWFQVEIINKKFGLEAANFPEKRIYKILIF